MSRLNQYIEMVTISLGGNDRAAATRLRNKILGSEPATLRNTSYSSLWSVEAATSACLERMKERQMNLQIGLYDKRFNIPKLMSAADPHGVPPVKMFLGYMFLIMKKKQLTSFDKFLIKKAKDNIQTLLIISKAVWEAYQDITGQYSAVLYRDKLHNGPYGPMKDRLHNIVANAWSLFEKVNTIKFWLMDMEKSDEVFVRNIR